MFDHSPAHELAGPKPNAVPLIVAGRVRLPLANVAIQLGFGTGALHVH